MTASYSVAFYADTADLVDGKPPAQVTYSALKEAGGTEYERVRDAIKRLIAVAPYTEEGDNPDMVGGPGSRWARQHLYRLGDDSAVPAEVTAYTIWITTPVRRWWLTWARDPHQARRLLMYSLCSAPDG